MNEGVASHVPEVLQAGKISLTLLKLLQDQVWQVTGLKALIYVSEIQRNAMLWIFACKKKKILHLVMSLKFYIDK